MSEHQPGDNHQYHIGCTICGEPGTVQISILPGRFGEWDALNAGTHKPAVDDFGNQYLERTGHRHEWVEFDSDINGLDAFRCACGTERWMPIGERP